MLQNSLKILEENWVNILSIGLGAIGVVGTVVGYLSWRSGNKQQQAFHLLFKVAEQHIEKDNLEEGIQKSKTELEKTITEVDELRVQIEKDIPLQARKAVLLDKLNTQIEYFNETHLSIQRVRSELEKLGEPTSLPKELTQAIESEINPDYIRRRRRNEYQGYLSLITGGSAIISILLPRYIRDLVVWTVMVPVGLPVLWQLIKYSMPAEYSANRSKVVKVVSFAMSSVGVSVIIFGSLVVIFNLPNASYPDESLVLLGAFIIAFGFLLAILPFAYRKYLLSRTNR